MGILIKILQVVMALAILVFVHELGHFLFARLFKIRVKKFYLFFDIKWALFRYKPKNSHTEYGLGWLPLGGYCQIDGMVDESLALEGLESEPKPWEFRSKPTWQRLLVMLGGVLFNLILAMLIYGGIAFHWGASKLPMANVGDHLIYTQVGHMMGLEDGDLPVAIDGKEIRYFEGALVQQIANGEVLTVERAGKHVDVAVPSDLMRALIRSDSAFFMLDLTARIDTVLEGSVAEQMGFQRGDEIVAVNGEEMDKLSRVMPAIQAARGSELTFGVQRGDSLMALSGVPDREQGLGVGFQPAAEQLEREELSYNFLEAIPAGISQAYQQMVNYVDQLKYVATPEGASSLGGLGTIGSLFPSRFNWYGFWQMTAFLSIILAVMNILPIPGLDGGHIVFLIYEMIVGRAPSLKWQTRFQMIGMIFLILLVLYANINDIFRFLL